ncbi:hypothetical protein [Guptibacillus hwajinpoensis]|uniref:Uncharacterized protein n=1 Tax=Guptibacillus hwajinpoensis TaxID=208199 RepID=A0ABU0JY43_9BACL|nr:hypothetical protein [Alkalihalobacillus hemicentroti]MDQ0481073.1 hypothetical protein [Alkalihalobacillus hemicentroti]
MSFSESKHEMEEDKQEREGVPTEKLSEMYRSQVSEAENNRGPFNNEEKLVKYHSHQNFKDAYKREVTSFFEPMVGKGLDKEENTDRQERLNQMRAFQETHSKEEVYKLKKESFQELKNPH